MFTVDVKQQYNNNKSNLGQRTNGSHILLTESHIILEGGGVKGSSIFCLRFALPLTQHKCNILERAVKPIIRLKVPIVNTVW